MVLTRKAIAFGAALAIFTTSAPGAAAFGRLPRKTMYLSFNVPVALPGVTLRSGTYIFEFADPSVPDVVRVLSRDRSRIHYLGFTLPVTRPDAGAVVSVAGRSACVEAATNLGVVALRGDPRSSVLLRQLSDVQPKSDA